MTEHMSLNEFKRRFPEWGGGKLPVQTSDAHRRAQATGAEWERQVHEWATTGGWTWCHFRPMQDKDGGWRTAVSGATGFPDTPFVHLDRKLFVVRELKAGKARPTEMQIFWIKALRAAGVDAGVWHERDAAEIARFLIDPRSTSAPLSDAPGL